MDYAKTERVERLAAEYAIGTLRGGARRRFERLLPAHPALARAVAAWLNRLQLLAGQVDPVEPPDRVWAGIQARLFGSANDSHVVMPGDRAAPRRRGGSLRIWQAISGLAIAASVALAVLLARPLPEGAPIVVLMQSTEKGAALIKTGFVASVSSDGRALVLKPLAPISIDRAHALELWAVPKQGAPRSLGVIADGQAMTTVLRSDLLVGTGAFAVSLEPAGGSPTGRPTGPILSAGEV